MDCFIYNFSIFLNIATNNFQHPKNGLQLLQKAKN